MIARPRLLPFGLGLALCVTSHLCVSDSRADDVLPADRPIEEVIDFYVSSRLEKSGVAPAPAADDAVFIRRVTLDLAGRIPTPAELEAYRNDSSPQRKVALVDRLLESPDFAYHHRNELDRMLMEDKPSDGAWREYLLQAARENRAWDVMFREMMLGREGDPEQKTSLVFLKSRVNSLDDLTNDTSRIFFGVNVSCAKCHDHPLVADWKQDHYFGFASFFERTYLTKKGTLVEKPSGQVRFKTTSGEEKLAAFMFLDGSMAEEPPVEKTKEQLKKEDEEVKRQKSDPEAPAPPAPEFSPRSKFVELALQESGTGYFTRSIVNRIWARLFGYGLVHPLDQLHSGNEPSHPALMDWLSRDTLEHQYDLKRLIRGIVLSEAYGRSSRWEGEGDAPRPEYFAVAMPRPLTPHQYGLSLLVATGHPNSFPADTRTPEWARQRDQLERAAAGWAGLFENPTEHFQVSVDEALLFSNNPRVESELLRDGADRLLGAVKAQEGRAAQIETAFKSILSRGPEPGEAAAFDAYLSERSDRPEAALQQMLWALLASPELRFNY